MQCLWQKSGMCTCTPKNAKHSSLPVLTTSQFRDQLCTSTVLPLVVAYIVQMNQCMGQIDLFKLLRSTISFNFDASDSCTACLSLARWRPRRCKFLWRCCSWFCRRGSLPSHIQLPGKRNTLPRLLGGQSKYPPNRERQSATVEGSTLACRDFPFPCCLIACLGKTASIMCRAFLVHYSISTKQLVLTHLSV